MSTTSSDLHESAPLPGSIRRRPTDTMSDFFRVNDDIGEKTEELMRQYDEDGHGYFTKKDVAGIICDLQEQFRKNEELHLSNRMLKKLLMAAIIFFLLLIASIFGLSMAVASLTKELSVNVNQLGAALTTTDGTVVSTDSRAEVYQSEEVETGIDCISGEAIEAIKQNVVGGKNVMVQRYGKDGTGFQLASLAAGGAIYDEDLDLYCYPTPGSTTGDVYCVSPKGHPMCSSDSNANGYRRLKQADGGSGCTCTINGAGKTVCPGNCTPSTTEEITPTAAPTHEVVVDPEPELPVATEAPTVSPTPGNSDIATIEATEGGGWNPGEITEAPAP